jgi:hypothetical protein
MRRVMFCLWFAIWPLVIGIVMPYVPISGNIRLINILWSIVYGAGFWIIANTNGLSMASPFLFFGFFVWPIAVSLVLFMFAWRLSRCHSRRICAVAALALVVSSFAVVSLDQLYINPFTYLPTFYQLVSVIY